MKNDMVRRNPQLVDIKIQGPKIKDIQYSKKFGPFKDIIKNSVLEGSQSKWYPGLIRDSLQIMNYREMN